MTMSRPAVAIPQTDPRAGYLAQRIAIDAAISRGCDYCSDRAGRRDTGARRCGAGYLYDGSTRVPACFAITAGRPAGGGSAGAHLWPAGRVVGPHRDRPDTWFAADRGLRAEPWRALSRQGGGIIR